MDTTILQVPISKYLRDEAALAATNMGFSSLQEAVRVFLTQLKSNIVKISFEQPPVQLSAKAIKRYDKISGDFRLNKNKYPSFTDVDKMMEYLNKSRKSPTFITQRSLPNRISFWSSGILDNWKY